MKIVSKDGNTWHQKNAAGTIDVGFTKQLIQALEECWHILPAASNKVTIKVDQPLCSVETNDGLFAVTSPVGGVISFFDNRAINFPDKIGEETIIAQVSEKSPPESPQTAVEIALEQLRQMEMEQPVRARAGIARPILRNNAENMWAQAQPVFQPAQVQAQQQFFLDEANNIEGQR